MRCLPPTPSPTCGTSDRPRPITGCSHPGWNRSAARRACWGCAAPLPKRRAFSSKPPKKSNSSSSKKGSPTCRSAWISASRRCCSPCRRRALRSLTDSRPCLTPVRSRAWTRSCCSTCPPPSSTAPTRASPKRSSRVPGRTRWSPWPTRFSTNPAPTTWRQSMPYQGSVAAPIRTISPIACTGRATRHSSTSSSRTWVIAPATTERSTWARRPRRNATPTGAHANGSMWPSTWSGRA